MKKERVNRVPNQSDIANMLEDIISKLRMVNASALKPEAFPASSYEDLKDIHDMVIRKNTFSPNEMQAIVEELGKLRN